MDKTNEPTQTTPEPETQPGNRMRSWDAETIQLLLDDRIATGG